ncbi:MAG: hypothetical protein ACOC7S_00650 [Planctomycetota bacterium]
MSAELTEQQGTRSPEKAKTTFTVESIPGGLIKALYAHSARKMHRYALDCILVEGRRMVAADGHVMAVVTLPSGLGPEGLFQFTTPRLRKREPTKLTRRDGVLRAEQKDGSSVRAEAWTSAPDGSRWPPNYDEVIPPAGEGTQVMARVDCLRNALELLDVAGFKTARITLTGEPRTPFRIDGVRLDHDGRELDPDIGAAVVISPVLSHEEVCSG